MTVIQLPLNSHLEGCPKRRIESYEAVKPDDEIVTVTRCIDCGEAKVRDGRLQDLVKRFSQKGKQNEQSRTRINTDAGTDAGTTTPGGTSV